MRFLAAGFLIALVLPCACLAAVMPVIYCTDLFHPHDDPDDHFDLAALFALPELDVKAIILDQGGKQVAKPGSIPVSQLLQLTSRRVPFETGLAQKLTSPADTGEAPFTFVPARVEVDDTGKTRILPGNAQPNVQLFEVASRGRYNLAMRDALRELFRCFPIPSAPQQTR